MTFREKLADWISGGAVYDAKRMSSHWFNEWQSAMDAYGDHDAKAQDALRRIAECETQGENATVKRMAKIAREAMK